MILALAIQLEDPKMWRVARGALQAARLEGVSLRIYGSLSERDYAQMSGQQFERTFDIDPMAHDGLIIASAGWALQNYGLKLHEEGFPTVLTAREVGSVPCVVNNNAEAIRELVHKLFEKGHRTIAFLAGPVDSVVAEERMSGYWQGLGECGLEVEDELILRGDYGEDQAYSVTKEALARNVHFTALIAVNDLSAIGAMRALAEAGMSPGADVEVTGFDNIPRSHWCKPSLSTFDTGLYQVGYEACTMLMRSVRGMPFERETIVPVQFMPRLSTWESEGAQDPRHPLGLDYLEHRSLYDSQLDTLRRNPDTAELLAALEASANSHESFLQTVRELLGETERLGFSAGCLFSYVSYLGTPRTSEEGRAIVPRPTVDAATSVLAAAFLNEQKRQTEQALRYHGATRHLRELAFSEAKEDSVIEALRRSNADLGILRAGIYLYDDPSPLDQDRRSTRGVWRFWDHSAPGAAEPVATCDRFDPALLRQASAESSWVFLPLLHGQDSLGFAVLEAEDELLTHYPDLVRSFTAALRACRLQLALAKANSELIETSRMAGLAEMATGVLHNIGNALNSVNTSCSLAIDLVRGSRIPGVARIARLFEEHKDDLPAFLSTDPKGRQLAPYLAQLGMHLEGEQKRLEGELEGLRSMIEHINQIVAAQQSHAQVSGILETIPPVEMLEFSLRLAEASLTRHRVRVARTYSDTPDVRVQRQKAVQILTNLIRNAKEALDETPEADRTLTLAVSPGREGFVEISIADNGPGIAQENLTRVFSFGFTTKKGGHGYGLHNGALAAREMGGSLTARSEGLGKGACFVLELPIAGSGS